VQIVLETERMLLRRFTGADAGLLAALYGDPRVMRFITLQPPSLAEVESKTLPAYLREYGELADDLGSFAAIEKATGQMAGRFSVKPASSYGLTGGTELGYRLYPALWGRGLATEGARALIASAFERLHLDGVVATAMAGNIGSCRVLENCGMRRVRTFCYPDADLMPGAEHGDFVYELTRSDWCRQASTSHQSTGRAESVETHPATSAAWITGFAALRSLAAPAGRLSDRAAAVSGGQIVLAPGLDTLPVPRRGTSCPAAQSSPAPPAPQPARPPSAGPRRPARAR
jgi:RimJ/RimL family protein N-acetyltransferase